MVSLGSREAGCQTSQEAGCQTRVVLYSLHLFTTEYIVILKLKHYKMITKICYMHLEKCCFTGCIHVQSMYGMPHVKKPQTWLPFTACNM